MLKQHYGEYYCPTEACWEIILLNMADLVRWWFLFDSEQSNLDDARDPTEVTLLEFPHYTCRISVFSSVSPTFHAPSGIGGMKHEHIRACPSWRNEYACNDCVFVITDPDAHGL
ncbi:uncharacterized protein EDB91DRAFT_373346 [Suillus paluster]|uniref:uncharacterized protein n=1 Tax=Suillus paluster TaxID=48578 RepID=UPI001B868252|nr:uncharacterized protein EDB91DRAFT_373346 [Suillus paluster]KAG1739910.1 hypothetical protein EDB91DRAFT_373346 [Suillus paluster]